MEDSDFTILSRKSILPFHDRTRFRDLIEFEGPDGRAVFITGEAAKAVRSRAGAALPNETGGLVAGRIYRDDIGSYAIVLGYVEAPPEATTPGTIRMTPAVVAELQDLAVTKYPGLEIIGWWHSHHGPSRYSRTDFGTQSLWTNESHVGLLVFATGKPWAVVYQGPTAVVLNSLVAAPSRPVASTPRVIDLGSPPAADDPPVRTPTRPPTDPGPLPRSVPLGIGIGIAAAAIALGGTALALAAGDDAPARDLDIAWECRRVPPEDKVNCEAEPVAGGSLEWVVGGTVVGTGEHVEILDPINGPITLRVLRTAITDLGALDPSTLDPAPTTVTPTLTPTTLPPTTSTAPAPTTTVKKPTTTTTTTTTTATPATTAPSVTAPPVTAPAGPDAR